MRRVLNHFTRRVQPQHKPNDTHTDIITIECHTKKFLPIYDKFDAIVEPEPYDNPGMNFYYK